LLLERGLERRENKWKLGKAKALLLPVEIHPEVTWYVKLLDGRLEECEVALVVKMTTNQK